jgi:hypothetical protein
MIFAPLGELALGELPREPVPTPAPAVEPLRYGGGKLIAAYTVDNNGKLRRDMNAYIEQEEKFDEEMMTALLMYWRNRDN